MLKLQGEDALTSLMEMILFDTSVWIRHFRSPERELVEALADKRVLIHETVVGELAVGRIPRSKVTLNDLLLLPFAPVAPFADLLTLLERQKLVSKGLSWIDIHLIASALLIGADLFTYDLPLSTAWRKIRR